METEKNNESYKIFVREKELFISVVSFTVNQEKKIRTTIKSLTVLHKNAVLYFLIYVCDDTF